MECPKCKSKNIKMEESLFGDALTTYNCRDCGNLFPAEHKKAVEAEGEYIEIRLPKLSALRDAPMVLKAVLAIDVIMIMIALVIALTGFSLPINIGYMTPLIGSTDVFLLVIAAVFVGAIASGIIPLLITIFYKKTWTYYLTWINMVVYYTYIIYQRVSGAPFAIEIFVYPVIMFLLYKGWEKF